MSTLGRLDAFGALPSSLGSALLLPTQFGPAGLIVRSLVWGGELIATPDTANARVQLDLFWPDVRFATIARLDADGTTSTVRNAEPALLSTRAVLYDHEAPLDTTFTYRVYPAGDPTTYWDSDPVTLTSGGASWLKHPFKPYLNRPVHLFAMPTRSLGARRGVARPIDRPDPVVVYQPRTTDAGQVVIQSDGTWAENTAIRALLADGAPLLLQQTGSLGEGQLYISVDTVDAELLDPQAGFMYQRNWTVPFDVVSRPAGPAAGPVGVTYDVLAGAFLTYEALAAGEASYADLAANPGP